MLANQDVFSVLDSLASYCITVARDDRLLQWKNLKFTDNYRYVKNLVGLIHENDTCPKWRFNVDGGSNGHLLLITDSKIM
jgi:hypothetical protein